MTKILKSQLPLGGGPLGLPGAPLGPGLQDRCLKSPGQGPTRACPAPGASVSQSFPPSAFQPAFPSSRQAKPSRARRPSGSWTLTLEEGGGLCIHVLRGSSWKGGSGGEKMDGGRKGLGKRRPGREYRPRPVGVTRDIIRAITRDITCDIAILLCNACRLGSLAIKAAHACWIRIHWIRLVADWNPARTIFWTTLIWSELLRIMNKHGL
ncbi:hypothetical protein CROQUDRAFT_108758 [Cronartium quercuum f. sp. fusiforme G11]|uniref:Uncharacterized protein n=1 Tax=Cronartium quercuum f. sp. fusiforme G11 TaxID=708437 RepID=A0A9P6NEE9_9BASI|nr:hypothetical protein CROQUDRAFT_108758 [Cronartium quercuum f. sp. fusiforme G11]